MLRLNVLVIIAAFLGMSFQGYGQTELVSKNVLPETAKQANNTSNNNPSHWYESFAIRGYSQVRYNRLLETNPNLKCDQCDKSWGDKQGISIRRMRIIFYGQISPRVYFYVQPDFASSAGSSSSTTYHIAQIRDAYMDLGLDKNNEFRIRLGQSKVPYGFENMQSSQNRVPLDRNDALNSPLSNERDMGAFFYWAPKAKRQLYSSLVKDGLKGSGDYGVFAFGAYNGQCANQAEKNNNLHLVTRLSYPFEIGGQIIEPGVQAYTGKYVLANHSADVKMAKGGEYLDQRVAGSFILYPKPFGIQAEYNIGTGPEFNKVTDSIENQKLTGGYITLTYLIKAKGQTFIPFTRAQYYDGGKKFELDARSYKVNELEIGIEWQPVKAFELTAMYTISERRFEDYAKQNNFQAGRLLRLQAQYNF
jgi:hypothetical protein